MAAFRKLLKTTKNKINRTGSTKTKKKNPTQEEEDEDFERRKQQWQEDLDEMSEFLVLKSTEEQRAEGVEHPVDTAYIDDREGMPILKAVFDVSQFRPEEVHLDATDNNQLVLIARGTDDSRECSIFRKTMIRKLDLPKYVEAKMMHCQVSKDGILTIEMPFHLPAQRKPAGPSVVPIITDDEGHRKIRFSVHIGPDFTTDDIIVDVIEGRQVKVTAFYDAEIGYYGSQVTKRRVERNFRLPDKVKVDSVDYVLSPDGFLKFEIRLVDEKPYKCDVVTEEIQNNDDEDHDDHEEPDPRGPEDGDVCNGEGGGGDGGGDPVETGSGSHEDDQEKLRQNSDDV